MSKQDVVSDEVLATFRTIGGQYSAFADYVCDPDCDPIDEDEEGYIDIFTQEWADAIDFDGLIVGDDVGDTDDDDDVYGWVFDRDVDNDDESLIDVAFVNDCRRLPHNYQRWLA